MTMASIYHCFSPCKCDIHFDVDVFDDGAVGVDGDKD